MFINNMDEPSVIIPYELRTGLESTARENRSQSRPTLGSAEIPPSELTRVVHPSASPRRHCRSSQVPAG